ncbi:serine/threonine-protein kinase [Streptomyces galbus]|uniref:non-specific serine/threonine protein kinase n=1 Tax=Streptomyces galbus TaxID=33898 RepID=A0A4U5WXQ5_STRGB|nr:serine/threonine-protein kinase [Streptomyces galbus]TKT07324.1 serine/threonine protein kinase [Streptomyces galbus]GHD36479.1 protein kinase [Streptomyces galbus]
MARGREEGAAVSEEPGSERLVAGRYRLLSPLGEGGMGTVWRARDEVLHREVAVKEVRAPAGLPAPDVERMYARLEREAWAAARVAHRNVVTVYDVATEDGRPWIVMELVRGVSLADVLDAEGPLSAPRAARVGAEVLAALRAAHAAGVLHRDVKPANVLLSNDDRVVLTDFGIATVEGSSALTMTGEVIGSPEFLAPERALGRTPGPGSDLWSLGVLLYAAVEGTSPFRQDTPLSTLRAIVDEELPAPRRAGPLAPVIEGLLRKDPAERLTAEAAERELRLVAAGGAPTRSGTVRADALWAAPRPPAAGTGPVRGQGPAAYTAPSVPVYADPADGEDDSRRDRRSAAVLIVGLLALALAVAGLTYAVLHGGDGSRPGGAAGPTGRTGPAPATGATGRGHGEEPSPSPSGTATGSGTPQSVTVVVTGARTDYSGGCPPAAGRAPAFTATITVGRLPAEVDYRWVTGDGRVLEGGWRTLRFTEGGGRSRQDRVVVTTGVGDGTYRDAVKVEVRAPRRVTSNAVAFSVACETETPSDGASPSASGSASGSAPAGAADQSLALSTGR